MTTVCRSMVSLKTRKATNTNESIYNFGNIGGNQYYMVKNSWGTSNKYEGIWYASKAFVRYKTMNIVVHKDALPKAIKAKLGIK